MNKTIQDIILYINETAIYGHKNRVLGVWYQILVNLPILEKLMKKCKLMVVSIEKCSNGWSNDLVQHCYVLLTKSQVLSGYTINGIIQHL